MWRVAGRRFGADPIVEQRKEQPSEEYDGKPENNRLNIDLKLESINLFGEKLRREDWPHAFDKLPRELLFAAWSNVLRLPIEVGIPNEEEL